MKVSQLTDTEDTVLNAIIDISVNVLPGCYLNEIVEEAGLPISVVGEALDILIEKGLIIQECEPTCSDTYIGKVGYWVTNSYQDVRVGQ